MTPPNIITLYYRNPRRRRERKGAEHLFEKITAENFPNLGKATDTQIQAAERSQQKQANTKTYHN